MFESGRKTSGSYRTIYLFPHSTTYLPRCNDQKTKDKSFHLYKRRMGVSITFSFNANSLRKKVCLHTVYLVIITIEDSSIQVKVH